MIGSYLPCLSCPHVVVWHTTYLTFASFALPSGHLQAVAVPTVFISQRSISAFPWLLIVCSTQHPKTLTRACDDTQRTHLSCFHCTYLRIFGTSSLPYLLTETGNPHAITLGCATDASIHDRSLTKTIITTTTTTTTKTTTTTTTMAFVIGKTERRKEGKESLCFFSNRRPEEEADGTGKFSDKVSNEISPKKTLVVVVVVVVIFSRNPNEETKIFYKRT